MLQKIGIFLLALAPLFAFDAYISNVNAGVVKVSVSGNVITSVSPTTSINGGGWTTNGIAISPDGQYFYVTDFNAASVYIVRIADNAVVGTVSGIFRPSAFLVAIAFAPDGESYYVVDFHNICVYILSTANNALLQTVSSGFAMGSGLYAIAFSPDEQSYYVTAAGGQIYIRSVADNSLTQTVSGIFEPGQLMQGIAFAPDGQSYYVTDYHNNVVYIVSTATNTLVTTVTFVGANGLSGIAFSPNGQYYYVTDEENSKVYTLTTIGNTPLSHSNPGGALDRPYAIATQPLFPSSTLRAFQRKFLYRR